MQWNRFEIEKRIVTVGETKTSAGTGRTIPMNADLLTPAIEYFKWYEWRFGGNQVIQEMAGTLPQEVLRVDRVN